MRRPNKDRVKAFGQNLSCHKCGGTIFTANIKNEVLTLECCGCKNKITREWNK
jgi:hypothetical protein